MKKLHNWAVAFAAMLIVILSAFAFAACANITGPSDTGDNDGDDSYCVVAFYAKGGSDVMPQVVTVGGLVSRPEDPTRDGHDFGGWYKDRDFTAEWNFDTDKVSGVSLILYAKWTPHGSDEPEPIPGDEYCIVTFNPDNGTLFAPKSVKVGDKLIDPKPAKDGCTLDGWYTSDGKKWNFAKDTVSGSTLVLTAHWTIVSNNDDDDEKCVVTFVPNCSVNIPSQIVKVGEKLNQPSVSKEGYTLDGWFNGNKKWDFVNDTVSGEALILTAKWTKIPVVENKCVVVFETNCSATVEQQKIDIGGKVTEPSITNPGYKLDGWYNGNTKWDFNNAVSGTTLTLTARWTANVIIGDGDEVTVTFNVGHSARMAGVYNPPAVTVKAGGTVSEPTVKRNGYTVSGWYVDEGNTKWNFGTGTVTENMTLYAKWQAGGGTTIQYTPTMQDNNTLYIHYLRSDNNYDNWYIYNWSSGGSQDIKNTVAKDASGAVYAISLSGINNGLSKINIIVTQPGWNKDGGDIEVVLSNTQKVGNSYHWYISQGRTADGGTKPVKPDPIGGGENGNTESPRASVGDVKRQTAQRLPVMKTVEDWDEMGVGYQIFVASFCDSDGDGIGDINGIISKLNYLKELNVDVLWLTPVQSSPSYHAYDCDDYYQIHNKFGTNADYRRLVSEVHKRGMKIIMDLVVNHTSPNNEWFQKSKAGVIEEVTYQDGTKETVKYRDFYRWKQGGGDRYCDGGNGWYFYSSFGGGMPELNYDCQAVRNAMADVAAYWMSFGLDGMRMDAIKHVFMWDEGDRASGDVEGGADDKPYNYNLTKNIEVFKELNHKLKTKYPYCFLLGEQLSGNTNYVSPFYQGMDSLFDFNTYFDMPERINGGKGGVSEQASAFNDNAQKYESNRGDRPINGMISSNHDVPRLSYKLDNNTEKMKLYMAVIMTMPGLSWIYYGDEIGLRSEGSNDNTYRQSMKWTSSWANKCTAIQDFSLNGGVKSVAEQDTDENSLLKYVKKLTKFRNDNPTLINGNATCSTQDGMLKITVTGGGKTYTVYHNFSGSSKSVSGTVVFGSSTVPAYGTAIVK